MRKNIIILGILLISIGVFVYFSNAMVLAQECLPGESCPIVSPTPAPTPQPECPGTQVKCHGVCQDPAPRCTIPNRAYDECSANGCGDCNRNALDCNGVCKLITNPDCVAPSFWDACSETCNSFNGITSESDPKVGSLTGNYLSKWGTTSLTPSSVYDNGTNVGIGTSSPAKKLDVAGSIKVSTGDLYIDSGRALRADGSGTTTLNIGNWGTGANGIDVNVYGNLAIGSSTYQRNLTVNGNINLPTAGATIKGVNIDNVLTGVNAGSGIVVSGTSGHSRTIGISNSVITTPTTCADTQVLTRSGTSWICATPAGGGGPISESDPKVGTLTSNYLSKWGTSTLTSSSVYDNGSYVGIGTSDPARKLDVAGDVKITNGDLYLNNGRSLSVNGEGTTHLYIGNWGTTNPNGVDVGLYGELAVGYWDFERNLTVYGDIVLPIANSTVDGVNLNDVLTGITAGNGIMISGAGNDRTIGISSEVITTPITCENNTILTRSSGSWVCAASTDGGIISESDPVHTAWLSAPLFNAGTRVGVVGSDDGSVQGSLYIGNSNSTGLPAHVQIGSSSGRPGSLLTVRDDTADTARIEIIDTVQNPELQLRYGNSSQEEWALYVSHGNNHTLTFWGNGNNQMSIDNSGNLNVVGTINGVNLANLNANAVRVDGTYNNPNWLTGLAWSKITGFPPSACGSSQYMANINANGTAVCADLPTAGGGLVEETDPEFVAWRNAPTLDSLSVGGQPVITSESDPKVGILTSNYLSKWGTTSLASSIVYDNGTNVGIGTASPAKKLDVAGDIKATGGDLYLDSAKAINVAGVGTTILNIGNWTTGSTGVDVNVYGNLAIGSSTYQRNLTVNGNIVLPTPNATVDGVNLNNVITSISAGNGIVVSGSGPSRTIGIGSSVITTPITCANNTVLTRSGTTWICATPASGITVHSGLSGLDADDHTQYYKRTGETSGLYVGGRLDIKDDMVLQKDGSGGTALVVLNQNNDTKLWTGLRLERKAVEKWFVGMDNTNENLLFRYGGTSNKLTIDTDGNITLVENATIDGVNLDNVLTGITAGNGIIVSGSGPSRTVGINSNVITTPTTCTDTQVLTRSGTSWICATPATTTSGLLDVLRAGADARAFTGPVYIGGQIFAQNGIQVASGNLTLGGQLRLLNSDTSPAVPLRGAIYYSILEGDTGIKVYDGTNWQRIAGGGGITSESDPKVGTLTSNYLSKWGTSTLTSSSVYDNGTNVGIGTANPAKKLDVAGDIKATGGDLYLDNGKAIQSLDTEGNPAMLNIGNWGNGFGSIAVADTLTGEYIVEPNTAVSLNLFGELNVRAWGQDRGGGKIIANTICLGADCRSAWSSSSDGECFGPIVRGASSNSWVGEVGGYSGANSKCSAGQHVCTSQEILQSINCGAFSGDGRITSGAKLWVSNGAPSLPTPTNDCNGWTDDNNPESGWQGIVWEYNNTGGIFFAESCGASHQFACCQ